MPELVRESTFVCCERTAWSVRCERLHGICCSLARTIGACVSVIAVGIGFAWALVDEERLTWHDYISKTFPSPRF